MFSAEPYFFMFPWIIHVYPSKIIYLYGKSWLLTSTGKQPKCNNQRSAGDSKNL